MKKILSLILSLAIVLPLLSVPVFASSLEEYSSVSFDQVGSAFTVKATGFEPSENRSYQFIAAAYGEGRILLGAKTKTVDMVNTDLAAASIDAGYVGSESTGAYYAYGDKTKRVWSKATTDQLACTIDFVGEAYKDEITEVKTMLWEKSSAARPIVGSRTFNAPSLAITEEDVALNAAAFAYGSQDGTTPAMAVDGDADTYWMSANTSNRKDYLILDLGEAYPITSVEITLAEGSDQNFTVMGASLPKYTDKKLLVSTITTLVAGTPQKFNTASKNAFRYIIFEQEAAGGAFGFTEIKVNTDAALAASHEAVGEVALAEVDATTPIVVTTDEANMTFSTPHSSIPLPDMTCMLDADPSTAAGFDYKHDTVYNQAFAIYMMQLASPQKLTHVAWQSESSNSFDLDSSADFMIIGSNVLPSASTMYARYLTSDGPVTYYGNFDVLATYDGASYVQNQTVAVNGDPHFDTGLQVFEVAEAYKNTAYKYVGVIKSISSPTARFKSIRLRAGTLQAYTKVVPQYNVALNAPAFAYGATDGNDMSKAVDGDANTAWVSANTNANYKDYLVLDLGAQYAVKSFDITMAAGSAQNFTIYGSNDAGLANKTALSEKVSSLANGTGNVASISSDAFRYIIFEQDAAEIAFGFKDIKVNSTTQAPVRTSATAKVAHKVEKMWYVNYPGYAQGNDGQGTSARAAIPNMVDADPESIYTIGSSNLDRAMLMIDLETAQKVSHIVYQGTASDAISGSSGYDYIDNVLVVASNDSTSYNTGVWDVVATIDQPTAYLAGDGRYDTGLMVFDVASVLGDTPYRYYGVVKAEKYAGSHRLAAGTLQVYAPAQ